MTEGSFIKPRDRDAVIQSLRAGVVPRRGQHLIQVGRVQEVKALLADIGRVADGGSAIRLVIGDYGSGKTFFLNLVRSIALEKKIVTAHADLSPERRLHSTGGHARSLFAELMRNLSTRTKPDGGAMPSVIERFVTSAMEEASLQKSSPESVIHGRLQQLSEMVGGYDFAQVVAAYWRGHDTGNEVLKNDAIRWLRGEFTTRTDAKRALGVRTIIDDESFYDHLKLMALFTRLAGYAGLLVCLDEMVNLYKLASTQARTSNYEQILRILNDSLQGVACGVGFVLGGTPDFLSDPRRGLFSYGALQGRLAENSFAVDGRTDMTGPVVRLGSLQPEDLYLLLGKVRLVFAGGDSSRYLVPDDALRAFMEHCSKRIGEAYFRTPRTTIKEWVNLLAVMEQNPSVKWQDLVGAVHVAQESNPDLAPLESEQRPLDGTVPGSTTPGTSDDDLTAFKL